MCHTLLGAEDVGVTKTYQFFPSWSSYSSEGRWASANEEIEIGDGLLDTDVRLKICLLLLPLRPPRMK